MLLYLTVYIAIKRNQMLEIKMIIITNINNINNTIIIANGSIIEVPSIIN
jgi:hypothetical protein